MPPPATRRSPLSLALLSLLAVLALAGAARGDVVEIVYEATFSSLPAGIQGTTPATATAVVTISTLGWSRDLQTGIACKSSVFRVRAELADHSWDETHFASLEGTPTPELCVHPSTPVDVGQQILSMLELHDGTYGIRFMDLFGPNAPSTSAVLFYPGGLIFGTATARVREPGGPSCGDGVLDDGEQCDDGNTEGGDGCSASCAVETLPELPPTEMLLPVLPEQTDRRNGVLGAFLSGDGSSFVLIGGKRDRNGDIKRVKSAVVGLSNGEWIHIRFDRRGRPKRLRDSSGFQLRFRGWPRGRATPAQGGQVRVTIVGPNGRALAKRIAVPYSDAFLQLAQSPSAMLRSLGSSRAATDSAARAASESSALEILGIVAGVSGATLAIGLAAFAAGGVAATVAGAAVVFTAVTFNALVAIDSLTRDLGEKGAVGEIVEQHVGIPDEYIGIAQDLFSLRQALRLPVRALTNPKPEQWIEGTGMLLDTLGGVLSECADEGSCETPSCDDPDPLNCGCVGGVCR